MYKTHKTLYAKDDNGVAYIIVPDENAGKPNRYTVIRWNTEEAEIIGLELTLTEAKKTIKIYYNK